MKNDLFANPKTLSSFAFLAFVFALISLGFCFFDDFSHTLILFFDYALLITFLIVILDSFGKGKKELVKAATASLFTLCFLTFAKTFVDMIYLRGYFIFSDNTYMILIGVVTILIFIISAISGIMHFAINTSNESKTNLVNGNKTLLIFNACLCLIVAALVYLVDQTSGKKIEFFLIFTYVAYFFVSLSLSCVEVLVNNFRMARERGELESFTTNLVGKKAAKVSLGKTTKKKVKKTIKKKSK